MIQAADTIKEMKENSFEVISQIDGMSDMCKQLQQVHLLGFKQDSEAEKNKRWVQIRFLSFQTKTTISYYRMAVNQPYYIVSIQVRTLVLIPEQIWSAIDEENFLLATQLFMLSSSIVNSERLPR